MALNLTPAEAVRRLVRTADSLDSLAQQLPPTPDNPGPLLEVLAFVVSDCAQTLHESLPAEQREEEGGHA